MRGELGAEAALIEAVHHVGMRRAEPFAFRNLQLRESLGGPDLHLGGLPEIETRLSAVDGMALLV
eukprot:4774772-Pyramimonas_sp.AAC.1